MAGKDKRGRLTELYEYVETMAFVVAALMIIFTFFFRATMVSGPSMEPTLYGGEWLVLQKIQRTNVTYGDIVNVDRTHTKEEPAIKRVIGLAGDEMDIDFEKGIVYRNGQALEEPYVKEPTYLQFDVEFPLTVPENCIFVLGDNRNDSKDSRHSDIGMVDMRRVMGKSVFRFFPLDKIGGLSWNR